MKVIILDDPVFGRLIDRGFGWESSFTDSRFSGWGSSYDDWLGVFGSNASTAGAYSGPLDEEPLWLAGRLKLVITNSSTSPITDDQRQQWKAFCNSGNVLPDTIADRLFHIYQQQRPELLRWWEKVYGDEPGQFLPIVASSDQMRSTVRPSEFRVLPALGADESMVAILFNARWAEEAIEVRIRDGQIASIGPENRGLNFGFETLPREFTPFGMLRWRKIEGWIGIYHSDLLRGFSQALEEKYRFKTQPRDLDKLYRLSPGWDVVTGNFELIVLDEEGTGPTPEQAAAYEELVSDQGQAESAILSALLDMWKRLRPSFVEAVNREPDMVAEVFPEIQSPEQLLDMIGLRSVKIGRGDDDLGVAIGFTFGWFDEHGLGVRWRDGKVEDVGDAEIAMDL